MKVILKEEQVRKLVEQIASTLSDDPTNNPLNTMRNTYNTMRSTLQTDSPELMKMVKNLQGFGDESLVGKISTIGKVLGGNKSKENEPSFAPVIPKGDEPMHPLGHKNPITSKFGRRNIKVAGASKDHEGIDISTRSGSPVYAPLDGTVVSSRDTTPNACGGFIQLSHKDVKTKFCHLRQMVVKQGENVKKGQLIGYTGGGKTDPMHGVSTGPHLHYEILGRDNIAMNPTTYQHNLV